MKSICIVFEHLTLGNGVARSAISIATQLVKSGKYDVTLIPIYRINKDCFQLIDSKIKVQKCWGFYFRGFDKLQVILSHKYLYKKIIGQKYDIEIAFQFGIPTRIIAAGCNIPAKHSIGKIAWMHGYDEGLSLLKCYQTIGKVICVSKMNAERLANESKNTFEIDYCYNPIDNFNICRLGNDNIDIKRPDSPLFVSVGRFTKEKGFYRLINILARLRDEGYHFHLWLIGDGLEKERLSNQIMKLSLNHCISLLGLQINPHKYTSHADAYICSSYSEGYSTACTEACMLGVPVITTPVGGAHEIVSDAQSGLVVKGLDDLSLYEGIKLVLDNPILLEEWKKKLSTSKEQFSISKRILKLFKILENL